MSASTKAYPLFHPESSSPSRLTLSIDEFRTEFPRETQLVEFKRGVSTRAIQETAVAFSNSHGGVLLLGVDDDGTIVGRDLTQSVEETIHQAIAETRNPGQYSVTRLLVAERPVVVISVAARVEGFAQTSNGRVLARHGPRNDALFDTDLLTFVASRALERLELRDSAVPLAKADIRLKAELAEVYEWDLADADERLLEHQLVTPGGNLTIAGALYLLEDPADRLGKTLVEVLRFPDDSTDYDKRTELRGPIHRQVAAATQAVEEELGSELVVLGVQRHQLPRIPTVVIREAIANAVAHRSYEANRTGVRIEVRSDAVKVISPGPLPVPVTAKNIRDAQAPRNLAVIRALRRFRLAEDAGRGVDVMQDSMRAELLEPPIFHDTGHSVEVTLPVRTPVTPRERAWVREVERRGEILPPDRMLLVHAARGEVLTNRRVREVAGLDRVEATRALQRLTRAGFLTQSGTRGGASYALGGTLDPPAGLRMGRDELKKTVTTMAAEGPLTNATVRTRLGIDRGEALRLLSELVAEGRLVRYGERKGTRYELSSGMLKL